MSYLTLPAGIPDFSKAVISFWFRVPQASITAAAKDPTPAPPGIPNHDDQPTDAVPNLKQIIPLITFGSEGSLKREGGTDYASDNINHQQKSWTPTNVTTATPSYIGIKCSGGDDDTVATALLVINLQMLDYGTGIGAWYTPPDRSQAPPPELDAHGFPANVPFVLHNKGGLSAGTVFNEEVIHVEVPGSYFNPSGVLEIINPPPGNIVPDVWHHLLISFDLSIPVDTQHTMQDLHLDAVPLMMSGPKLWLAYDDVNYDGEAFGSAWPQTRYQNSGIPPHSYPDRNMVITPNGYFVTYMYSINSQQDFYDFGLPSGAEEYQIHNTGGDVEPPPAVGGTLFWDSTAYQQGGWKYENGKIKTSDHPIGIPAAQKYVDRIHRVELAELQLFTDVTLDTKITSNRRVFVDGDGKPVSPTQTQDQDDPRAPAEKLLGKQPDILLHGSGNWKTGKNTGSIGIDLDGNEIPEGQFDPTGGIEQYKPDPVLEDT